MDILAARKKAAEQAKARQQAAPEAVVVETPVEEAAQAAETVAAPVPEPAAIVEVPEQKLPEPVAAVPAPAAPVPEASPQEDAVTAAPQKEVELLSFLLGGEEYVVMVKDVREVLKVRDRTLVPNAPAHILGVASLRGTMLPIIDLCKPLGLTATPAGGTAARVVVVKADEEQVGLLVDRVTGVLRILPEAIKPAPENVEQGGEYLRGIVRKNDKLYILLDLEKAVRG